MFLGVGALVIGLIFYNLRKNPEWQTFSWNRLWASIIGARLDGLLLAAVCVLGTFFFRAIRWWFFMEPIKRASLWTLFVGQILGFSSIFLIGRPGELVRPAYIAKKESVPMSAMLAVWLLERAFDTIAMVVLFAAALYFGHIEPATARGVSGMELVHKGGNWLFGFTGLVVLGLVLFRLKPELMKAVVLRLFRFLPRRALRLLEHVLHAFGEALGVIRDWKGLAGSVATTAVVWCLGTSVFWLVFKSLGGEMARLGWLPAAFTLFCAALGLVVQIPGVGGGYPAAVIFVLTDLFNVSAPPASGAGILVWVVMSVPCLALGLILLIHEGLSFRKLEAITKEEEAAASLEKV